MRRAASGARASADCRSYTVAARRLATYQLTIGPNVLRIVHADLVPTEVFRHEVTRIEDVAGGLRIRYGAGRLAGVPRTLDGYDAVHARLAAWHAIERRPWRQWLLSR